LRTASRSSEARLLAEIEHPGIVAYVAHGQAADRRRYLAMEWLDGNPYVVRALVLGRDWRVTP
jgi:endo-alpha-1,4-polygalactosaminidase (GH114 family)